MPVVFRFRVVFRPVYQFDLELPEAFLHEEEVTAPCEIGGRVIRVSVGWHDIELDGFEAVCDLRYLDELEDFDRPAPFVQVIEVSDCDWDFFGVNDGRVRVHNEDVIGVQCLTRAEAFELAGAAIA